MPARLAARVMVQRRGREVEIQFQHRNQMVRCIVVGTVLVQHLQIIQSRRTTRNTRMLTRRLVRPAKKVNYRFTCTVCRNVCATKEKHLSACPSCVNHDVPPSTGKVRSTGVCVACADKWRRANNGKEICVTCNRELV